jgi:hypothetical protein
VTHNLKITGTQSLDSHFSPGQSSESRTELCGFYAQNASIVWITLHSSVHLQRRCPASLLSRPFTESRKGGGAVQPSIRVHNKRAPATLPAESDIERPVGCVLISDK